MPERAPWRAPAGVLASARRITDDLMDGLSGTRVRRAAHALRRLFGVPGLGISDLSGSLAWSGRPAADEAVAHVLDEVLHSEEPAARGGLAAVPLHVHDELAGALVLLGERGEVLRQAADLVVQALERGRLEASADQAAQAELRALRAEMSPHFVYNALTVIASLVRSEPDRARELMLDFADYTRYSLARHGEYTVVAEEFRAVETYLALQRAVLGERLKVQVRVAPEVLAVAVPYLVLEPLVENAIRHGIEPRSGTGLVQVHGQAEGNDCVITVEDDGVGMAPKRAADILAGHTTESGLGMANVDRRLRNVYGAWYGLTVETEVGAGTRVVVRVPRFQPGVLP
ncbi:sensor histidine kinase [Amycolatopsis jiangsuensis]|uniref:histidine kinase n=1 Tax=Amycolatopsis jiangsuensis TaxID=1181879 RepID=A0A840IXI9_9PSEU|nr:histidine kinase [Amycolatopsis jiangsuensis]MBB4685604.1 two-component system LytT family sensor kinase [Amycolatopsis jiangsuensis]